MSTLENTWSSLEHVEIYNKIEKKITFSKVKFNVEFKHVYLKKAKNAIWSH
jgi:hypothetical protein